MKNKIQFKNCESKRNNGKSYLDVTIQNKVKKFGNQEVMVINTREIKDNLFECYNGSVNNVNVQFNGDINLCILKI